MYDLVYLAGTLFWTGVWMALWIALPQCRRTMLWTGLLLAPAGPIAAYWSLQDYWHPTYILSLRVGTWEIGLEDYWLCFVLAGICSAAMERLAEAMRRPQVRPTLRATGRAYAWLSVGLAVLLVCIYILRMPSMNAILLMTAITAVAMMRRQPRLLGISMALSIAFAAAYWLFYVGFIEPLFPGAFAAVWKLDRMWGVNVGGVPLEEVLWAGVTMLIAGPLLRACSAEPRPSTCA